MLIAMVLYLIITIDNKKKCFKSLFSFIIFTPRLIYQFQTILALKYRNIRVDLVRTIGRRDSH